MHVLIERQGKLLQGSLRTGVNAVLVSLGNECEIVVVRCVVILNVQPAVLVHLVLTETRLLNFDLVIVGDFVVAI